LSDSFELRRPEGLISTSGRSPPSENRQDADVSREERAEPAKRKSAGCRCFA
jgi:hypothetical protein